MPKNQGHLKVKVKATQCQGHIKIKWKNIYYECFAIYVLCGCLTSIERHSCLFSISVYSELALFLKIQITALDQGVMFHWEGLFQNFFSYSSTTWKRFSSVKITNKQ